jgi:hypothetical protein
MSLWQLRPGSPAKTEAGAELVDGVRFVMYLDYH